MSPKTQDSDQWVTAVIIGILGGLTLLVVNIVLNRFVFHVKLGWTKTLITAIVFAIVFTIVSFQWDKKKK